MFPFILALSSFLANAPDFVNNRNLAFTCLKIGTKIHIIIMLYNYMRDIHVMTHIYIWDALRDLVPFVQIKKRKKHPWRSVTFSKVAGFTISNTPPWVFFTFFILYK